MNFHSVACGYVVRVEGGKQDGEIFGSLRESITNVAAWMESDRKLSETCLTTEYPTYCLGVSVSDKLAAIALLDATDIEAEVTLDPAKSIKEIQKGKRGKKKATKKEAKIKGRVYYFVLNLETNQAAIFKDGKRTGTENLRRWMRRWVVATDTKFVGADHQTALIGASRKDLFYMMDGARKNNVVPRFTTSALIHLRTSTAKSELETASSLAIKISNGAEILKPEDGFLNGALKKLFCRNEEAEGPDHGTPDWYELRFSVGEGAAADEVTDLLSGYNEDECDIGWSQDGSTYHWLSSQPWRSQVIEDAVILKNEDNFYSVADFLKAVGKLIEWPTPEPDDAKPETKGA